MPKKKVVLNFPPHLIGQAITYRLITDYGLVVNILRARITPQEWGVWYWSWGDGNERLAEAVAFLTELGVRVEPLPRAFQKSARYKKSPFYSPCGPPPPPPTPGRGPPPKP